MYKITKDFYNITEDFHEWVKSKDGKIYKRVDKFMDKDCFIVVLHNGIVWTEGYVPNYVYETLKRFIKEKGYKYWYEEVR